MYDLDTIRENIARHEREQTERIVAARAERKARGGARLPRATSPAVRRRLRDRSFSRAKREALSSPDCPPLRRARLERDWTLKEAAAAAGVGRMVWYRAEHRESVSAEARAKIDAALKRER